MRLIRCASLAIAGIAICGSSNDRSSFGTASLRLRLHSWVRAMRACFNLLHLPGGSSYLILSMGSSTGCSCRPTCYSVQNPVLLRKSVCSCLSLIAVRSAAVKGKNAKIRTGARPLACRVKHGAGGRLRHNITPAGVMERRLRRSRRQSMGKVGSRLKAGSEGYAKFPRARTTLPQSSQRLFSRLSTPRRSF